MSFPIVVESAPKEVSLSQVFCSFFGSPGEQDVEDGTRILELEGRKISSGFWEADVTCWEDKYRLRVVFQ